MQKEIAKRFFHPISHIDYQVTISIPDEDIPPNGFPVLYLLDGNAYGTMVKEIIRLQSRRPEKTGVKPMVIVQIGYDTSEIFPSLRVYDFTPPSVSPVLPNRPDGTDWPTHGGADEFTSLLKDHIIPFVNRNVSVHTQEQMIFGHSLGGLFVLYLFFRSSNMFTQYLCCSPSIWWNEREILQYENYQSLIDGKKLVIGVEDVGKRNMFADALNVYERMQTSSPNMVQFLAPTGENHMSIVPTIISSALRFLLDEKNNRN